MLPLEAPLCGGTVSRMRTRAQRPAADYLKATTVAAMFETSPETIRRLLADGILPSIVIALRGKRRMIRIPRAALEAALARLQGGAK